MSANYNNKYPEGTFKICPNFIEYNTRSCRDLFVCSLMFCVFCVLFVYILWIS